MVQNTVVGLCAHLFSDRPIEAEFNHLGAVGVGEQLGFVAVGELGHGQLGYNPQLQEGARGVEAAVGWPPGGVVMEQGMDSEGGAHREVWGRASFEAPP